MSWTANRISFKVQRSYGLETYKGLGCIYVYSEALIGAGLSICWKGFFFQLEILCPLHTDCGPQSHLCVLRYRVFDIKSLVPHDVMLLPIYIALVTFNRLSFINGKYQGPHTYISHIMDSEDFSTAKSIIKVLIYSHAKIGFQVHTAVKIEPGPNGTRQTFTGTNPPIS